MTTFGPARIERPGLWGFGRVVGYPVTADISSPFGPRQPIWTPAGWTSDFHNGVDLPAPGGTPIICPVEEMEVTAEGPAWNGYGNAVFGRTPDGFSLLFAHMQAGAHVGVGQVLKRGQVVGQVGTTGASTGDHLHFGVCRTPVATLDVSAYINKSFWLDPVALFWPTVDDQPIAEEPKPTGFDYSLFISNSLRALALNPPADMGAALLELARRVEYLRSLGV